MTKVISISESRPRFRVTKRSGMNLRRHPRALKLAICNSNKNLINPNLGRAESYFEPQRIDDRAPRQVSRRSCLKDLYGVRTAKLTGSTIVRASAPWKFKNIDRRLDVILHRSGLANSIIQARQRISHGHVFLKKDTSVINRKRPSYIICLNEVIYIDPIYWSKFNQRAIKQWKLWPQTNNTTWRTIPSYLEVDYLNGSLIRINYPNKNNILIPAGLGKTTIDLLYSK